MAKTKFCEGVSDISDSYMGFIIDQWGVLHDGEELFPGAVDCLKELKERKKTIIILSNAEGNEEENKAKLKKMGLGPSLYNCIITPTEIVQQGYTGRKEGTFAAHDDLVHLARSDDEDLLGGVVDGVRGQQASLGPPDELEMCCDQRRQTRLGGLVRHVD